MTSALPSPRAQCREHDRRRLLQRLPHRAAGEIVGIAGVVGNGQSQLLRALAGLERFTGTVAHRRRRPRAEALARRVRLPAGRPPRGRADDVVVGARERRGRRAEAVRPGPLVSRHREVAAVRRELQHAGRQDAVEPRLPSRRCPAATSRRSCWPGRCCRSPGILIADEPTQGVDVGARAEIYRILREVSAGGVPVVVASSDAKELEGLCDRVIVMSRGQRRRGAGRSDEITEERIINAAVRSTAQTRRDEPIRPSESSTRSGASCKGDYAPAVVLSSRSSFSAATSCRATTAT